jgi:hypothetical protein
VQLKILNVGSLVAIAIIGVFSFLTCQAATSIAIADVVKAGKVPSNDWIGKLDTKATKEMLDKYTFEKRYTFPLQLSILSMLIFSLCGSPFYFVLRCLLVGGQSNKSQ